VTRRGAYHCAAYRQCVLAAGGDAGPRGDDRVPNHAAASRTEPVTFSQSPKSTLTWFMSEPRAKTRNPYSCVSGSGALTATSVASAPPSRATPWLDGWVSRVEGGVEICRGHSLLRHELADPAGRAGGIVDAEGGRGPWRRTRGPWRRRRARQRSGESGSCRHCRTATFRCHGGQPTSWCRFAARCRATIVCAQAPIAQPDRATPS
jgi:hypothetical protein